jgi:molybdopterin-guanine dinucleotide biosynthesis protein A
MTGAGFSGVVLVGGRSQRMGRDKARLLWDGVPLWRRQRRLLERAGARPVLLALRPYQRSFGERAREIRDRHTDLGPISGLQAALAASAAEWVAVLAVDMPHIDPAWFRRLRARCRPGGVGAVVVEPEGYQPLAAIYPGAALPIVARRIQEGKLSLQGLVAELVRRRRLVPLRLAKSERWRAANWNHPADLSPPRRRKKSGP